MDDRETVAAFIERIVAGAHIPSRAGREALRRELWTHFDAAGGSPDAVRDAMRRFGAESMIADSFQRVYRWDYFLLYLAKIAASITVSAAVALLIQVVVNLRVELQAEVWRLAPGFSHAAGPSVGFVLALVTAREAARRPFNRARAAAAVGAYATLVFAVQFLFAKSAGAFVTASVLVPLGYACSKVKSTPAKLPLTFGAFTAAVYTAHAGLSLAFGPARTLLSSAVLVAVWTSTAVILARVDHAFVAFFETAKRA